jgi:hypothetical protein
MKSMKSVTILEICGIRRQRYTHVIFRISENACFGQTNKCVCVTHEYGSKG